jgi:ATP-dependent Lon protease
LGKKQNQDGFALWLSALIVNTLGPAAAAVARANFETIDGKTVCRVDVDPTSSPVFVHAGKATADFYVRINNSTRLLNTAESLEYVHSHWR